MPSTCRCSSALGRRDRASGRLTPGHDPRAGRVPTGRSARWIRFVDSSSTFRKHLLWGIVLIVVGLLVGPGGVSIFTS
ncbi:GPGG-motif small membrane protein [Klenkia terrae]|uniref:GPGG-motif small membrane protein n=1 Tax=Klenkia terrae TaxID=1052259 RepID=UPI00296ED3A5|nr:GPGG-motif small membrane protein [Klenkia terrae]